MTSWHGKVISMRYILRRKTLARTVSFHLFPSSAYGTRRGRRTWEQSRFEELTKGIANGVALRSEGGIELAPAFKTLATTPSTYIWSIASDSAGNIFAAAGSPARRLPHHARWPEHDYF